MSTQAQMAMIARYRIALLIRPPLAERGYIETRRLQNRVPTGSRLRW
jgi:hypothetical protein